MAMGVGVMDFVHRFQTIQQNRDTSNELIKDLLLYAEGVETSLRNENKKLSQQLNDAQLDLADATKSRRDLQQKMHDMQTTLSTVSQNYQYLKDQNLYVIVLIDGDGLLFKDCFVKQGIEGGKKAAYALRAAILHECGNHVNDVEVIAKVCLNLSGMCKALWREGSVENENDFRLFTLGFTQAKASFDFVDVGHGKERADSRIKELTRWNLRNHNCRQVILGISHDAGYAPFVDEIFQDPSARDRITILEGFPTVRELASCGVNILNLNERIFRPDKIGTYYAPVQQLSSASISPPIIRALPEAASAPPPPIPSAASASYARAIKTVSPPPQLTLPLQPRPASTTLRAQPPKPLPQPVWSPGPRGLDEPISVSTAVLDSIRSRKDSSKLCNNHFLRGPCTKRPQCQFEHNYSPSKDEINAIAYLARLNPCTNGQDCDVDGCIYGHHCPSVDNGRCTRPYCKFGVEDHPPGTKLMNLKPYEGY